MWQTPIGDQQIVSEDDSELERESPPPKVMWKPGKNGEFKKDGAGFLESEVFTYKRKKDEEVQALLEEFRNGGHGPDNEPYKGKFHKVGESPTRRLIRKHFHSYNLNRDEDCGAHSPSDSQSGSFQFSPK